MIEAKRYEAKLAVRFPYSTNGQAIDGVDMATGTKGEVASCPRRTRCGRDLGRPDLVRRLFVGFQHHLYTRHPPG